MNQTIFDSLEYKESKTAIDSIFETYANDEYMLQRIHQYISVHLAPHFVSVKNTRTEKTLRVEELCNDMDSFTQNFLHTYKYSYYSTTEKFFFYDGLHYSLHSEDDVIHHILRTVTETNGTWKQRTKVHIIKKIKDTNVLKTIPNSETIQNVLQILSPSIFQSKSETKYFLTILGDLLLKKRNTLIHFISPKMKKFIQELNNVSQILLGYSCGQTFKYKYHEHDFSLCRILNINDSCLAPDTMNVPVLDVLCVAAHYSIRYDSSDEYLSKANDDTLSKQVLFLKDTTQDDLIQQFKTEYIISNDQKSDTYVISWKHMFFLWRHFLDTLHVPNVIFQQSLKAMLIKEYAAMYDESSDSFLGLYSKWSPAIQNFLKFWNTNMIEDILETDFEIDELMTLMKNEKYIVNQKQAIDLITYFFPTVEIENDKYIHKMRCKLWDKQIDIQNILDKIRTQLGDSKGSPKAQLISIYDIYEKYCKTQYTNGRMIVSKNYFEKYIQDNFYNYIINDTFLSNLWLH